MKTKLKPLDRVALVITKAVGTMVCAIIFALIACISLPAAIKGGTNTLILWFSSEFLQLVLLAVIMVGQNIQNNQSEKNAEKHYKTLLRHEEKIDRLLKSVEKLLSKSKK